MNMPNFYRMSFSRIPLIMDLMWVIINMYGQIYAWALNTYSQGFVINYVLLIVLAWVDYH